MTTLPPRNAHIMWNKAFEGFKYTHHAFHIGEGHVVEFNVLAGTSQEDLMAQKAKARVLHRELSPNDNGWIHVKTVAAGEEMAALLRAILVLVKCPEYHLLYSNCEHVATFICTGAWVSIQAEAAKELVKAVVAVLGDVGTTIADQLRRFLEWLDRHPECFIIAGIFFLLSLLFLLISKWQ